MGVPPERSCFFGNPELTLLRAKIRPFDVRADELAHVSHVISTEQLARSEDFENPIPKSGLALLSQKIWTRGKLLRKCAQKACDDHLLLRRCGRGQFTGMGISCIHPTTQAIPLHDWMGTVTNSKMCPQIP